MPRFIESTTLLKGLLLIAVCLLSLPDSKAISIEKNQDYGDEIYAYSDELFYRFDLGVKHIDSLKNNITDYTYQHNKAYFQYGYAIIDYEEGRYNQAIKKIDSALEVFLWNKQNEWEARSFLIIGYIAEAIRLRDEAIEAYKFASSQSNEIRTQSLAYFGLARSQKREKEAWKHALSKGQDIIDNSDSELLKLYELQATYWFFPDSASLPTDLERLGHIYEQKKLYSRAANTYKLLSRHFLLKKNYDKALQYIDHALSLATDSSDNPIIMEAGMYYLKGAIYQSQGNEILASKHYSTSIRLFLKTDYWHINYITYRYLYLKEKKNNNFSTALDYNNKAMACLKRTGDLKSEWVNEYIQITKKRELILQELKKYNQRLYVIILVTILAITTLISLIIRYRKQKQNAEKDYEIIKSTIGESLINVRKRKLTEYLNLSQLEMDRRIDKHLVNDKQSIQYIKDNLAPMLLEVEKAIPQLTETETKCASLFALGCTLRDVEDLLCVKYTTVKIYRTRIRKKLNISDSRSNFQQDILTRININ